MASKLPPPRVSVASALHAPKDRKRAAAPSYRTTAQARPYVHPPVPAASHVYSPSSVASSASPSSSPEVAAAPVIDVPPRLELRDLSAGGECSGASTGLPWPKRAIVTTERSADAMERADKQPHNGPDDVAQKELEMDNHTRDLQQASAAAPSTVRTGIPSIKMASAHARVRSNSYKHGDAEASETSSRIARYGPKKKPMVIDTNWSDDIADESCSITPECHSGSMNAANYSPKEVTIAPQHVSASPMANSTAQSPSLATCPSAVTPSQEYHTEAQNHSTETLASVEQTEQSVQSSPKFQGQKTNVRSPKTPSGGSSYEAFVDDDESRLSASQRVRMGLSAYMAHGHSVVNGTMEPMRRHSHDDSISPNFKRQPLFHASGKQHFSMQKVQRSQRGGADLIVSKLLPSRQSLNSLMGYVRELQQSEASLREQLQLERSKHRTEQDAIERQMMEQQIEMEREQARRKREEQEQIIRDLQARIAQLHEEKQHEVVYDRTLERIHEDEVAVSDQYRGHSDAELRTSDDRPTASDYVSASVPGEGYSLNQSVPQQTGDVVQSPTQAEPHVRNQHQLIISPRGTKPLWDPWSSDSPLTPANAPMFTIALTSAGMLSKSPQLLGFAVPTAPSSASSGHVLKSVLSPKNSVVCEQESETPRAILQSEEALVTTSEIDAPPAFSIGEIAMPAHSSPTIYVPTHEVHDSEPDLHAVVEELQCPISDLVPETTSVPVPPCVPSEASLIHESPRAPATMAVDASEANPVRPPSKLFQPFQPHPVAKSPRLHDNEPANPRAFLEKLLKDFFEEVDKAKLRMAEGYVKRYVGHEERLFAELSRRYGSAKVEELKYRYENNAAAEQYDTSESIEKTSRSVQSPCLRSPIRQDAPLLQHPNIVSNVADTLSPPLNSTKATTGKRSHGGADLSNVVPSSKVSPKGRSQSMNGFHPPMPLVFYDPHADHTDAHSDHPTEDSVVSSPTSAQPFPVVAQSAASYEKCNFATANAGEGEEGNASSSDGFPPQASLRHRVCVARFVADNAIPGRLRADIPPPPMIDFTHVKGGSKASPIMRQGELSYGPPPPLAAAHPLRDEKSSAVASPTSTNIMQTQQRPSSPQMVTLESLLRDLYKKHQPDKLQSVARVAREYAGKERALVQLLKTKYGALSVKHLEENLALLEKSGSKPGLASAQRERKKRGLAGRSIRFLTRCALLSASAMVLAGAGIVYIDSQECALRAAAPTDAARSCDKFDHDLSEFEFGKLGQYLACAYPVGCMCSEWRKREDALVSSSCSWGNAVSLAQLLPFSQSTAVAYFENSEYYHRYGKPVANMAKTQEPMIRASLNQFGGKVSSVMADIYGHIYSPKVLDLGPELLENGSNTAADDDSVGNESAEDSLTKMAQASRSLLASKQAVDTSVEIQGGNDSSFTESTTHEEDRDGPAFDVEERDAFNALAAVELEVRQEGIALSFLGTEREPQPVCSLLSNERNASIHKLNETEEEKILGDAATSELLQVDHVLLENVEETQEASVIKAPAIEFENAAIFIDAQAADPAEPEIVNSGESDDDLLESVSEGERSTATVEQPTEFIAKQLPATEGVDASLSEESISATRLDTYLQVHAVDTTAEAIRVEETLEPVLSAEVVDSLDAITEGDSAWMEDEQAAAATDEWCALDATNSATLEADPGGEISAGTANESSSEATVIGVAIDEETPSSMDEPLAAADMELDTSKEAEADEMALDEVPLLVGTREEPSDSTSDSTEAHQATAKDGAMDAAASMPDTETQAVDEVSEASQTTEGGLEGFEQQAESSESSNQVQLDDSEHTTAPQSPDAILQESSADDVDSDVVDFDDLFAFDASELLEMAERVAAAQLA